MTSPSSSLSSVTNASYSRFALLDLYSSLRSFRGLFLYSSGHQWVGVYLSVVLEWDSFVEGHRCSYAKIQEGRYRHRYGYLSSSKCITVPSALRYKCLYLHCEGMDCCRDRNELHLSNCSLAFRSRDQPGFMQLDPQEQGVAILQIFRMEHRVAVSLWANRENRIF